VPNHLTIRLNRLIERKYKRTTNERTMVTEQNRTSWGPRMPEQRYGKRAVNELRAMETYKKTKNCCQLCLLLSNNNV